MNKERTARNFATSRHIPAHLALPRDYPPRPQVSLDHTSRTSSGTIPRSARSSPPEAQERWTRLDLPGALLGKPAYNSLSRSRATTSMVPARLLSFDPTPHDDFALPHAASHFKASTHLVAPLFLSCPPTSRDATAAWVGLQDTCHSSSSRNSSLAHKRPIFLLTASRHREPRRATCRCSPTPSAERAHQTAEPAEVQVGHQDGPRLCSLSLAGRRSL